MPRGTAQLSATIDGHYQTDPFKNYTFPTEGSLTLKMTDTGAIHGKVIGPNGQPLAEGHVDIWPEGGNKVGSWGGSTTIKDDGTFRLEVPESYRAILEYGGRMRVAVDAETLELQPQGAMWRSLYPNLMRATTVPESFEIPGPRTDSRHDLVLDIPPP